MAAIPMQIPDTIFDLKITDSGFLLNLRRSSKAEIPHRMLRMSRTVMTTAMVASPPGAIVMSEAHPSMTRNIAHKYQDVRIKIISFSQPTLLLRRGLWQVACRRLLEALLSFQKRNDPDCSICGICMHQVAVSFAMHEWNCDTVPVSVVQRQHPVTSFGNDRPIRMELLRRDGFAPAIPWASVKTINRARPGRLLSVTI